MTSIKNFLFIFLLGTALPTFCMEFVLKHAEFHLLYDDGEQWTEIAGGEDLKKFEGMLFAFRYRSALVPENTYSIHPPTCYGILSKVVDSRSQYQWSLLDHLGTGQHLRRVYVPGDREFNMRRLTLEEASALNGLHKEGDGNFREMLRCLYRSEIPAPGALFKLKHLTPKQQRHYVKKHFKSRLALCSLHKKRKSPVNGLPKEILGLIAQQVIDLEVQNGERVLKLE